MLLAFVAVGQVIGDQTRVNFYSTQGIADLVSDTTQHLAQLRVTRHQLAPHFFHRLAQVADFIVGRSRDLLIQVAQTDLARGPNEFLDRPR